MISVCFHNPRAFYLERARLQYERHEMDAVRNYLRIIKTIPESKPIAGFPR